MGEIPSKNEGNVGSHATVDGSEIRDQLTSWGW